MAQVVYKMRQLLEYVRDKGINQDFKTALEQCVRLTKGMPEVEIQPLSSVARDVARNLDEAYRKYHRGYSRPLPYGQYEKFMEVCRGWGSFMGDQNMLRWKQETPEEYEKSGGVRREENAKPGGAADAESMQELLEALEGLVHKYGPRV